MVRRRFQEVPPSGEGEEPEVSFTTAWCGMVDERFVVDGSTAEEEGVRALYPEVCAALDRQKTRMTPDAVLEAVEEIVRGLRLSPERHAQAIYAAEWYAGLAFPGCLDPGGFPRPGRRTSRRNQIIAMFRGDYVEEVPQDPAFFAVFPSPEEVEYALRLSVPSATMHDVYETVSELYRTFGAAPDFPTLVERLRRNPEVLGAGYAPVWYVWRMVTDLHLLIRDRMQEVRDAAGAGRPAR
ncbi:hypothetical protein FGU65_01590 [Methanoculleus sp. FWC-SCC1]|uniref:Uncharacterized protein n=1 Tax=Methanoculleus frigidifontis TaxID=2584085 RepID=A0ABT8M6N9_9EURY|nr:hypothetical protein [Methanoculleus sp. FWC-SCC1]MDN7023602.1 hypothetical protein [Methanoculleus sp. FWC-SCC1]